MKVFRYYYGTAKGGMRAAKTNLERHGKDFYKNIGRIGGARGRICDVMISKESIMNIKGYEEYKVLSNGVVIGKNGNPMKPQMDNKGYLRIQLRGPSKENGVATFKVHRLVASHYIPNPNNLPQVDHIDGDKTNNSVDNLEWVSNEENQRRAKERGVYLKRTPVKILEYGGQILLAISKGYVASDLFDKYGINHKTFWKAVEDGRITISDTMPDTTGVRKRKYYYFDKSRNMWRVERSDYIPTGKQFKTEEEAKRYAEQNIEAGGFCGDSERAKELGSKGGRISKRGFKAIRQEDGTYEYIKINEKNV